MIFGLVGLIAGDGGDALELVAPVLRKLRRTEPELPADVIATVGGALIASALGYSPTAWRRRSLAPVDNDLPVPVTEAYAWTVTGRLLVDLLDHTAGAGTAADVFSGL